VEVLLKGTHENNVFDERTVSFTLGEGFLQNIPEGFVVICIFYLINLFEF